MSMLDSVEELEKYRWLGTFKTNQPVVKASQYQTIATSTTATDSGPVNGPLALIASAGADHFVSFDGPATTSSALIPQGALMMFEIDDIPDGTTVSVITASGSGHVTIYNQI